MDTDLLISEFDVINIPIMTPQALIVVSQLKQLQLNFDIRDISPNTIILFDMKHNRFYNPEKYHKLYNYVSYDRLFDTVKEIRNKFKQLLGLEEIHFDSTVVMDLEISTNDFARSVQESSQIDEYILEIKKTIEILVRANELFLSMLNKESFIDLWTKCYDMLIKLLGDAMIEANDMYYCDRKMYDIVHLLINAYKQKELDLKQFKQNEQPPPGCDAFSNAFWGLTPNDALIFLNNRKNISYHIQKIIFDRDQRVYFFSIELNMVYSYVQWVIYYRLKHHIKPDNIDEFNEFCNKIQDRRYVQLISKKI